MDDFDIAMAMPSRYSKGGAIKIRLDRRLIMLERWQAVVYIDGGFESRSDSFCALSSTAGKSGACVILLIFPRQSLISVGGDS